MKQNWLLREGNLTLRPLTSSDLPMTRQWRNDSREHFLHSGIVTEERHRAWFDEYVKREDDYVFIIELDERPVGQCSLYNIDRKDCEAEFGRLLVIPSQRKTGIAKRAMELLLRAAVGIGLHTFYLRVRGTNKPAVKLYTKQGFHPILASDGVLTMRRCE